MLQLCRGEARLGLLTGYVYLQQDVYLAVDAGRLALDGVQQTLAVHTLDEVNEGDDEAHLVGLQMANHMPADVLGQGLVLGDEFLHPALAEVAFAYGVGFLDQGDGVELADAHQRDVVGDVRADGGDVLLDWGHREQLTVNS